MAAVIDDLVKLYKDKFGIDDLVIVSDNVKIYKESQGRRLIFDDSNRMIHSIEVNTDGTNFGVPHLLHFESFMYDQVQFMGNYGDAPELVTMLDMLESQGCIDKTKRNELIKYFQDHFAFTLGYGENPYNKGPNSDGSNNEQIPVDNNENILTTITSQSINSIRPVLNENQEI